MNGMPAPKTTLRVNPPGWGYASFAGQAQTLRFGQATLNLAGLDFQPQRMRDRYLHGAERLIVPGATNILLQHNPDVFPTAARQGYNLLLAGGTHVADRSGLAIHGYVVASVAPLRIA